jgi:hypothetical protein
MEIKGKTKELLVKQLKTCKRNMQELTNSIKRPKLRIMVIEEGEEVQAKGIHNIFNKIITEKFPNLEKSMPIQIQEASRTPNRLDQNIMEKRQPLQQIFLEKCLSACKKLKLDPCLSPCTSINPKWIKDLNIRPKTLKLVQERVGNTLEAIDIGKDFLNRTPAAQQLRESIDKWDFIKLKNFCTTEEMVSKLKRDHPQSGRKYLPAAHKTKD